MFNSKSLIAIDIGSSAIKVVELAGDKHKKLVSLGLEVLPMGCVVDGMMPGQDVVEAVLKDLLKKLRISPGGRRAALSLGGSGVVIKKVFVSGGGRNLEEQVFYAAEQHFQADLAEIYFDFAELPRLGPDKPVLLVGARREMVEQYIGCARAVGLRTGVVECGQISIANMFEHCYGVVGGLTAIVNVGASSAQFALISHGEYLYTKDIPIGGEEYSRQIMEAVGVDRDNAETLKVAVSQGDGSVPPEVLRVLGAINEQLVGEIQMALDFYLQGSGDQRFQGSAGGLGGVFLTGGGARVLGLDAALAAALQVPVQIVNPFQGIEINQKKFQMDYLSMQGHLFGVAVGLGMRAMGDR